MVAAVQNTKAAEHIEEAVAAAECKPAPAALSRSLQCGKGALALSEADILRHARLWVQRLAARKLS